MEQVSLGSYMKRKRLENKIMYMKPVFLIGMLLLPTAGSMKSQDAATLL
jgi:hypothetical protein